MTGTLSRACELAGRVVQRDLTNRRVRTLMHACCEREDCQCPCHRAVIELVAMASDPLPIVHAKPGSRALT